MENVLSDDRSADWELANIFSDDEAPLQDVGSDDEPDGMPGEALVDEMLEVSLEELAVIMASRALYAAVVAGDREAAEQALINRADVDYDKSGEYRTPLIIACRQQKVAMVKFLLGLTPQPATNIFSHGATAITHVFLNLQDGDCNTTQACLIINMLINAGCDLNIKCAANSMSPLMQAVKLAIAERYALDFQQPFPSSMLPVIDLLVDNGADIEQAEEFYHQQIKAVLDGRTEHYYQELFRNMKSRRLNSSHQWLLSTYQGGQTRPTTLVSAESALDENNEGAIKESPNKRSRNLQPHLTI